MRRKLTLVVGILLGALTAGLLIGAPSTAAFTTFTHPGVLVGTAQLDFTRNKVNSGSQPWKSSFDAMMASKYASLSRTPKPRAVVECGSYSDPNYGCTDEREDALAAYTLSLAWYVTREGKYADKAIQIMDAWSGTIKDHTNSNAPLQTGWAYPPGRAPPRSSATRTTAGPRAASTASPECCGTSTCPRSSTARTATGTGNSA